MLNSTIANCGANFYPILVQVVSKYSEHYEEYVGICENVQQQNCDVLVDIRYRDTPEVSKMARCFRSFFCKL